MRFIRKVPKPLSKILFKTFIIFDEVFWKLRIKSSLLIFGKKSQIGEVLEHLENNGYAVFSQFYDNKKIEEIKKECLKILDQLPAKKIKSEETIQNLILSSGLNVEKLKESIKIKGLDKFNTFFKDMSKNSRLKKITSVYQLSSNPLLAYNLVHDGSYNHPAISKSTGKKMIAGQPHIDMSLHSLRCALALENIESDNGPTVVFKKSMGMKKLKKNHLNIFFERFGFDTNGETGHNLDNNDIQYLEKNSEKKKVVCKKGDLVLIDLKTAHFQSILKKGQRHLIWYYL